MGKLVILLFACLAPVVLSSGQTVRQLLDSLSTEEKAYFIRYNLAKALESTKARSSSLDAVLSDIPDDVRKTIQELDALVPADFPYTLYNYTTSEFSLTITDVRSLVTVGICCTRDNSKCYNPGDISYNCCY